MSLTEFCERYIDSVRQNDGPADLIEAMLWKASSIAKDISELSCDSPDQISREIMRHKQGMRQMVLNYVTAFQEELERDAEHAAKWYLAAREVFVTSSITEFYEDHANRRGISIRVD